MSKFKHFFRRHHVQNVACVYWFRSGWLITDLTLLYQGFVIFNVEKIPITKNGPRPCEPGKNLLKRKPPYS